MHVSKNRVEGSLSEINLERLLEPCRRHLFTGTIEIRSPAGNGLVQLHAGAVDESRFGELTGDAALAKMTKLSEGDYQVVQRVPDLSGELGSAAGLEGEVSDVPIAKIMRHCEQHALTCVLTVVNGFERGEITYRAGDLVEVSLNGTRDDDSIVAIVGWKAARFRVVLPPLDLEIKGWPTVKGEPTAPFKIAQQPPPAKRAASVEPAAKKPAEVVAEKKPAEKKPVEVVAEKKPIEVVAEKKPAEKKPVEVVAEKKPVEVVAEKKPAEVVAEKKPAEKKPVEVVAEKKPAEVVAEKKPAEVVAEKKPAEVVAEKKPAEVVAEKKPVEVVAEKEPVELVAQKKPADSKKAAAEKPASTDKPADKKAAAKTSPSSERPTAKEAALDRNASKPKQPQQPAKAAKVAAASTAAKSATPVAEPEAPATASTPFRIADLALILAIIAACALVAWLLGKG